MTVSDSNLMKSAVQVAVANSFSKKNVKLWIKQALEGDPPVSESEIAALRKAMKKNPPWTPWSRGGGSRG